MAPSRTPTGGWIALFGRVVALWLLGACGLLGTCAAQGAEMACDPATSSPDPLGYAWRGGFCEGRCSEDVASRTVDLLSLHVGSLPPLDGREVVLHWPSATTGSDRLVIRSVDVAVCYRLDAVLPPSPGRFVWHTEHARRLGPAAKTLGVIVRRETPSGEPQYLAVSRGLGGPLISRWVAQVPLRQITISWRRDGREEDGTTFEIPAARWRGYQPGVEALEIELMPPPSEGLWYLVFAALTPEGEPVAWEARVLGPGGPP